MALITRAGSERIVRYAFDYAVKHGRKKVTLVHKANILKFSQGLFLDIGRMVAASTRPDRVRGDDRRRDGDESRAASRAVRRDRHDEPVRRHSLGPISGLVGGLGLAPGANIGVSGAIFEAVHGTAPDIAGKGVANPGALMLAACMLLEHIDDRDRAQSAFARRSRRPSARARP